MSSDTRNNRDPVRLAEGALVGVNVIVTGATSGRIVFDDAPLWKAGCLLPDHACP